MSIKNIVGRQAQLSIFKQAVDSNEAELIAVYGRRRVGKTYLIREFFDTSICFELIGIHGGSINDQLISFSESLRKSLNIDFRPEVVFSWKDAFLQLEKFLDSPGSKQLKGKRVVFFDELPWLNTAKSNFVASLDHFWNSYGSKQNDLIVVVCGSAASWMIQNIVKAKGGLHNRLTRQIRLLPFTLGETRDYLKSRGISNISNYMLIQLYMTFGGIPFYLKQIQIGMSAAQAIDAVCFSENGQLRYEYDILYSSLFDNSELHLKVIEQLAITHKGLSRAEILKKTGIKSGGSASKVFEELEESGFIEAGIPFGKKTKDSIYRLSDEFSLFHHNWIKPLGKRSTGEGYWLSRQSSQKYKIWTGYAFESLCLKHVKKIKEKLGISGIETSESPWRYFPDSEAESEGTQIDLLIDRKDGVINLCEIKFNDSEFIIDSNYSSVLRKKIDIFKRQTKTRKSIFVTMITTFGLSRNSYAIDLETTDIKMDDLF